MKALSLILLLTIAFSLTACAPKRIENPGEVMLNTDESLALRIRAIQQANEETPDDPDHLKALLRVATIDQHAEELRFIAIDHLMEHDRQLTRDYFGRAIAIINHWPTYEKLTELAIENKWTNFIPAYVERLTKNLPKYQHEERPEHEAISELTDGQDSIAVAWDVFNDMKNATGKQRATAWQYLHQQLEKDELIKGLLALHNKGKHTNPMIHDIGHAFSDWGFIPADAYEILWLQYLKAGASSGLYTKALKVIRILTDDQKENLELRHLPILVHAKLMKHPYLKLSREDLVQKLYKRLTQRERYERNKAHQYLEEKSERIEDHKNTMAWADALTLLLIDDALKIPEIKKGFFEQADEDLKDQQTELGGLMVFDENDEIAVLPYPPAAKNHDRQYLPKRQMIVDGYTALTTYHFHAQLHKNKKLSGPGQYDMHFVEIHHLNAIVLTFINEQTLNVDWFADNGMMIDLGTIKRAR